MNVFRENSIRPGIAGVTLVAFAVTQLVWNTPLGAQTDRSSATLRSGIEGTAQAGLEERLKSDVPNRGLPTTSIATPLLAAGMEESEELQALIEGAEYLLGFPRSGVTVEKTEVLRQLLPWVSKRLQEEQQPNLLRATVQQIESAHPFTAGAVAFLPRENADAVFITDLHGDYKALQQILKQIGYDPETNRTAVRKKYLIFGGDFVDGGPRSLDVLIKVLTLYLLDPDHVILMAGNIDRDRLLTIEEGKARLFLQLTDRLGWEQGPHLYSQWLNFARKAMVGAVVTKNGFAFVHASPPSIRTLGYDPKQGLLAIAYNKAVRHAMAADSLRRPNSPSQHDGSDEENLVENERQQHHFGASYPPVHTNGIESIEAFLAGTGTRFFLRGHDSGVPADQTLIGGKGLTVHASGQGSPETAFPKTVARYTVIQLDRDYTTIDPKTASSDEKIVRLVWPISTQTPLGKPPIIPRKLIRDFGQAQATIIADEVTKTVGHLMPIPDYSDAQREEKVAEILGKTHPFTLLTYFLGTNVIALFGLFILQLPMIGILSNPPSSIGGWIFATLWGIVDSAFLLRWLSGYFISLGMSVLPPTLYGSEQHYLIKRPPHRDALSYDDERSQDEYWLRSAVAHETAHHFGFLLEADAVRTFRLIEEGFLEPPEKIERMLSERLPDMAIDDLENQLEKIAEQETGGLPGFLQHPIEPPSAYLYGRMLGQAYWMLSGRDVSKAFRLLWLRKNGVPMQEALRQISGSVQVHTLSSDETDQATGLEEPTEETVRQAIEFIRTGGWNERRRTLVAIREWLHPPLAEPVVQNARPLVEALLNLVYTDGHPAYIWGSSKTMHALIAYEPFRALFLEKAPEIEAYLRSTPNLYEKEGALRTFLHVLRGSPLVPSDTGRASTVATEKVVSLGPITITTEPAHARSPTTDTPVQSFTTDEFLRRFPGVDVPVGTRQVILVRADVQTLIHIYVDPTLLSGMEEVVATERDSLPNGVRLNLRQVPASADLLGKPGAIFWHWLIGRLYKQQILPEAELDNAQPMPRLVSIVLFALRGPGAKLEAIIGMMTLQDAQGNTVYAYFV